MKRTAHPGIPNQLTEANGESCTVGLTEPLTSTTSWRCELYARLPSGMALVRTWTTVPRSVSGAGPSRVLAVATIPGAVGFDLQVVPLAGGGANDWAEVTLDTQTHSGGLGCAVVDETALAPPDPATVDTRAPVGFTGAAGVVAISSAHRPKRWSVWAAGAGATVSISYTEGGIFHAVLTGATVPPGGVLSGEIDTEGDDRAWTFTFVGTSGYLIEAVL